MDDKHRSILRCFWSDFRTYLEPLKLLPYLVDVLSLEDEQEVKAKVSPHDMTDKLLEILPKKGATAFDSFVKALKQVRSSLAAELQDAGMIKSFCPLFLVCKNKISRIALAKRLLGGNVKYEMDKARIVLVQSFLTKYIFVYECLLRWSTKSDLAVAKFRLLHLNSKCLQLIFLLGYCH